MKPIHKAITTFSGMPETILLWESKGLSNEKIMPPCTKSRSLSPKMVWNNSRIKLKLKRKLLKTRR